MWRKFLLILLIFQVVYFASSCSRRRRRSPPSKPAPRPCSWQTCRHEWRNPFEPRVTRGQCTPQKRYSNHVYSTHHSTEPCPASQACDWRVERKTLCSCYNTYNCYLQGWTAWSGNVPQRKCATQTRYRDWGFAYRYQEKETHCRGILSSCGPRQHNQRKYCSCPYVRCDPSPWTQWSVTSTPSHGHCKTESRYQGQRKTILYRNKETNCNNVNPQNCPAGVTSTREKIVYCVPLPNPKIGKWDDPNCSKSNSPCRKDCTLDCSTYPGFKRKGTKPTRQCLSDGTWSSTDAYCKDEKAPTVTCPKSVTYNNDPGKPHKKVSLTGYSASDNSGKVGVRVEVDKQIVTTNEYNFRVSQSAHEVVVTATDDANLKVSCYYYVTVKDAEKPKAIKCPDVLRLYSNEEPAVVKDWSEHVKFQDNFDTRLKYSNPQGNSFYFGAAEVIYTATDSFDNVATCRIRISAAPHECPVFLPPKNGAQSCNIKVDDKYEQKFFCINTCQKDYGFKTDIVYDAFQCLKKQWNGLKALPDDDFKLDPFPKNQRPWSDCVALDSAEGVKKTINAYVGKCNENSKESLEKIKQAFVDSISFVMYSNLFFCFSHDKNCMTKNVKIYCGKSKRDGDTSMQVISVEFVILDNKKITDKAKALRQHQMMKMDLDAAERKADKKIVSAVGVSGMHIESYETKIACKDGEVVQVNGGDGDEILRSQCVKCEEGTFFDKDDERCTACPEGTYQEQEGAFSCKKCPDNTWTIGARAGNQTECLDICGPGEYSQLATGLANCLACPMGTYQPGFRQSKCIQCPDGKTTKVLGVATKEDCV